MSNVNDIYIRAKEKAASILHKKLKVDDVPPIDHLRIPNGQRRVEQMIAMPPITFTYPHTSRQVWSLKVYGEVEKELVWTFEEFEKLGVQDFTVDFHCVTTWSKLDQKFSGIDFKKIVELIKPTQEAKYVIFECEDGYTTNVILQEILDNTCIIATKMDGEDISDKYGGPVRGVIPHLYGWKSAKFLKAIRFSRTDEPGFWETRGYNNHADPWKEERYS
jgi:DMSO/TMAO reductase YedYZ molybdopterin-dependent catalytic subunit